MLEALKGADLDCEPDSGEGVDPAPTAQSGDILGPRRAGHELHDRGTERVAAQAERVDRADAHLHSQLRAALAQIDLPKPAAVPRNPSAARGLVSVLVVLQQLRLPMPRAHQIT